MTSYLPEMKTCYILSSRDDNMLHCTLEMNPVTLSSRDENLLHPIL